jgi:basic membrane protein A
MSKKILALLMAVVMVVAMVALSACSEKKDTEDTKKADDTKADTANEAADSTISADFKVGFIFLHDENSTYDKNFMDAAKAVQKKLGLSDEQVIFKVGVPEGNDCYEAAADMVDAGCKLVFADSFGHEPFMVQAAKEFTDVQFCHATGTMAHTENLSNFHDAFASIYEGRYCAGIAAGMKLNEMIANGKITEDQAKIGYVGAYPYAEVKSGYTSFFLGARSVCASATMEVKYTQSWFDIALEREAAIALIDDGCVLISQHADSEGAPKACEERGIPNVSYNVSTIDMGPTTAIISSKINWEPYLELIITKTAAGKGAEIPADWCGGFNEGAVELTELNTAVAAEGTQEKIDEAVAAFKAGELKVFATSAWTKDGKTLDEYMADVDTDDAFTPDHNVIHDGYFDESAADMRSAPYFDILIDGITEK